MIQIDGWGDDEDGGGGGGGDGSPVSIRRNFEKGG